MFTQKALKTVVIMSLFVTLQTCDHALATKPLEDQTPRKKRGFDGGQSEFEKSSKKRRVVTVSDITEPEPYDFEDAKLNEQLLGLGLEDDDEDDNGNTNS